MGPGARASTVVRAFRRDGRIRDGIATVPDARASGTAITRRGDPDRSGPRARDAAGKSFLGCWSCQGWTPALPWAGLASEAPRPVIVTNRVPPGDNRFAPLRINAKQGRWASGGDAATTTSLSLNGSDTPVVPAPRTGGIAITASKPLLQGGGVEYQFSYRHSSRPDFTPSGIPPHPRAIPTIHRFLCDATPAYFVRDFVPINEMVACVITTMTNCNRAWILSRLLLDGLS